MSHPDQAAVRNGLLASLSPDDFSLLRPHLGYRHVRSGEVLIEPNKPIRSVYFPEDGLACFLSESGALRVEVGLVGREGFVGASIVLDVDRVPLSASVQIAGGGFEIDTHALLQAVERSRSLRGALARYTHAFMMQAASTVRAHAQFSVEQRVARCLLMLQDRLGEDDLRVTHDLLAQMLCVRRPGVTTATHVIEGAGAIRAMRGQITIRDRRKLMSIAHDSYGFAEAEYARVMRPGSFEPLQEAA